jgi:hypothetical protein
VKITGDWPGTPLLDYDSHWKTYDFEGYTALNLIFNTGKASTQTGDLSIAHAGYWYYYQSRFYTEDPLTNPTPIDPGLEATDYLEFPLWNELTPNDKTVVSPYQGQRDDFRDESIYFAMTTRFYNGDPSNDFHCWDGKK